MNKLVGCCMTWAYSMTQSEYRFIGPRILPRLFDSLLSLRTFVRYHSTNEPGVVGERGVALGVFRRVVRVRESAAGGATSPGSRADIHVRRCDAAGSHYALLRRVPQRSTENLRPVTREARCCECGGQP